MLARLVEDFRRHRRSPVEEIRAHLARLERRDGELHAWTEVFRREALAEATRSAERWRRNRPLSPLDGVAVAIKDIIDVAGRVTGAGVAWRYAPASRDATIVTRLRQLGMVLLGKTVTTPFACFDPPPTVHPLDPECTPGGSSSGSAVAVADGHVPVALGTQTGGSIIRPASYCGVAGFKPTFGRLPLEGIVPVSSRLDHLGFLARTASDVAYVWNVLRGGVEKETEVRPLRPERLGDLPSVYAARSSEEVRACHAEALDDLRQRGVPVEPAELPWEWEEALAAHRTIMAVDAAREHGDTESRYGEAFPPRLAGLIEEGRRMPRDRYEGAVRFQERLRETFEAWWSEQGWDGLLMPATRTTAPRDRSTTGDPSFNSVWTMLGVPVLTIPLRAAGTSLPCGLQWIAPWKRDDKLCRHGLWYRS